MSKAYDDQVRVPKLPLKVRKAMDSGEGVEDLENKHHCCCFWHRRYQGYRGRRTTGDGRWVKMWIQPPGNCGTCGNTGWCY